MVRQVYVLKYSSHGGAIAKLTTVPSSLREILGLYKRPLCEDILQAAVKRHNNLLNGLYIALLKEDIREQ